MKFEILRETLLKPLQQVIGVVERRQTLPVLGNVLVNATKDGLELTATDLEVELQARTSVEIEEPGDVTIPARKLFDICKALPDGVNISISVKDDRVLVKSGRSRFTLSTLPATEFPLVEKVASSRSFEVPQKAFKELIERTHFSMAQQDVRYYLNGLMLELNPDLVRAVATDGHRLALCDMPVVVDGADGQQVIVPRKGIQELLRLLEDSDDPALVELGSNHIRVATSAIRFTSKLIDGRFPDYERVVPKGGDKSVIADRDLMRQALTRTSILSNEKYRGIRLNLDSGALRIQAHNPEQEQADEEIEVEYQGDSLEIGFNVTYLLDALSALRSEQVETVMSDSNSSCLVQEPGSNRCQYVVMPMRL